jgi:REP element-mobilizing transposase RayT
MRQLARDSRIGIVAYCLMSNHVHVVLLDSEQTLSTFVRRLCTSFAMHYNELSDHTGPVFQGRFFSVPLETDAQLLEAIRYVHQNPVKARISAIDDYEWSSYNGYLDGTSWLSTSTVLDMLGGTRGFKAFMSQPNSSYSVPVFGRHGLTDQEALELMHSELTDGEQRALQGHLRSERDASLRRLRWLGIGVTQAARLTGLGRSIVSRAYGTVGQPIN